MSVARLAERLEAGLNRLPGGEAVAAVRRAQLQRFAALGLPDRRIERWHYTDLKPLGELGFDYLSPAPDANLLASLAGPLDELGLDPAAPRLVFVDGSLVEALSLAMPLAGLNVEISDAATTLQPADEPAESALAALNAALATGHVRLRIDRALTQPVQLVFVSARPGTAAQVSIGVELDTDASARIVEHFVTLSDEGESWLNLMTNVTQSESSRLELYRLQQLGPAQYGTSLLNARLARNAALTAWSAELGGKLVRNELEIALEGENAEASVFGLALTADRQHCDTRIAVDHRAARTNSFQEYRAIAADSSRSIFNGKVTVREDAQHIEARQRNDNLLLSRKAEIDTKPELEIYADQVICSHGATVGELSDEQLFYLRARGIDQESARGMLTAAFAEKILSRLGQDGFAQHARAAVDTRLPRRIELG